MIRSRHNPTRNWQLPTVLCGCLLAVTQVSVQTWASDAKCPGGQARIGDLGITSFECNCSHESSGTGPGVWRFFAEPRVLGVAPNGPADGRLEPDDIIVSIDDLLITTVEGGQRWSRVRPHEQVRLRVRREGVVRTVVLDAGSRCPGVAASSVPARSAPRSLPRLLPRGWLGLGMSCNCSVNAGGTYPQWTFEDFPRVDAVATGSPAARADIRAGDVLIRVNALSLLSEEGATAFSRIQPGERITLTLRRDGREHTVHLDAEEGPNR